jgi:uncharacterized protein YeaO (DUF488 family)
MSQKIPKINLVRVYEITDSDVGYRILVDRMWPRGIKKDALQLDGWMKNLAPSTELRKWFNHLPERWDGFREKYGLELDGKSSELEELLAFVRQQAVLLIYSARDVEHNNAVALREYLLKAIKK